MSSPAINPASPIDAPSVRLSRAGAATSRYGPRLALALGLGLAVGVVFGICRAPFPPPAVAGLAGVLAFGVALWRRPRVQHTAPRGSGDPASADAQMSDPTLERRLTVAVLAADTAHDLATPLAFFADLLAMLEAGRAPSAEDIAIGREELERSRRLLATLRLVRPVTTESAIVALSDVVALALAATPEAGARPPLVEVPRGVGLRADLPLLVVALVGLLRNARAAAGSEDEVGIACARSGADMVIDVWNSARAPVPLEPMFRRWSALKPDGSGLGLAVITWIIRRHGWRITPVGGPGRTTLRISVPASDVAELHEGTNEDLDRR